MTATVSFAGGMRELLFRVRRLTEPSLEASPACLQAVLETAGFTR